MSRVAGLLLLCIALYNQLADFIVERLTFMINSADKQHIYFDTSLKIRYITKWANNYRSP